VFIAEFNKIIDDNDFPPGVVFNENETGLCWEKLLSITYISKEEKWLLVSRHPRTNLRLIHT
jgi:hypothetical protein